MICSNEADSAVASLELDPPDNEIGRVFNLDVVLRVVEVGFPGRVRIGDSPFAARMIIGLVAVPLTEIALLQD
jgi:hypothetical protein